MTYPLRKKVAVIGAGVSGLVTVKELLAAGHEPVCLERAENLGGVFRFGEEDGVVWESCRLTSSGYLTAFSDFPVSADRAGHMRAGEYVDYLEEYCSEFGLLKHVQFNQPVQLVTREDPGRWLVTFGHPGAERTEAFDAVVVCSGLHQHPHIPEFPGLDSFSGETLHAGKYRRPAQVRGKTALVVGAGESGADIAAEVAKNAQQAYLSLRRGVAAVPRLINSQPRDFRTSRLANGASHWIGQTRNPEDSGKRRIYRTLGFPLLVIERILQLFHRYLYDILPLYLSTSRAKIRKSHRTQQVIQQLLRESGGNIFEQFGTKDTCFVEALVEGTLQRVPGISHFDGAAVHFEDGQVLEPDIVIFCTGFETRMPFLEQEIASAPRYLNTFNPQVGCELGFVGFIRPAFGAIPPLAELQARWVARLLAKQASLPSMLEMKQSIETSKQRRHHVFSAKEDRLVHLVDHTESCDALARQVGCMPCRADLAKESRSLRKRFMAGPLVAAQYRLVGPGAKPEQARNIIESMPIAHPWPQRTHLRIRWWISRMLYRMFGAGFEPKLSVD